MAKRTVYVVTAGEYSSYGIINIFSTAEKAAQYMRDNPLDGSISYNSVEDYVVDADVGLTRQACHACTMGLVDGYVAGEWALTFPLPPNGTLVILSDPDGVRAYSTRSIKHARKLAAEARQKWLRERDAKEKG